MDKQILAISGRPGLFLLLSRGRTTLIVESLDVPKKRQTVGLRDRISSLNDISIYTEDEDIPLMQVFENIRIKEQGAPISFNPKKASNEQLYEFLAEILPNFNRERVYPNDIRKIIMWYNTLIQNGYTQFLDPSESSDNIPEESSTNTTTEISHDKN